MLMQINKIKFFFYKLKMKCNREEESWKYKLQFRKTKKFMPHTYMSVGKELFINGQLVFSALAFIMW